MKKCLITAFSLLCLLGLNTGRQVNALESMDRVNSTTYKTNQKYIGNINSELKTFTLGESNGASYVSGEIVVVEWVDGQSTVPAETPKMTFVSTDGEVEMEVFVTPTGTNTYYFDRFISGIDASKTYQFKIESGNSNNISEYRSMYVYSNLNENLGKVDGNNLIINPNAYGIMNLTIDIEFIGDVVYQQISWSSNSASMSVRNDGNLPVKNVTLNAKIIERATGNIVDEIEHTFSDIVNPGQISLTKYFDNRPVTLQDRVDYDIEGTIVSYDIVK